MDAVRKCMVLVRIVKVSELLGVKSWIERGGVQWT